MNCDWIHSTNYIYLNSDIWFYDASLCKQIFFDKPTWPTPIIILQRGKIFRHRKLIGVHRFTFKVSIFGRNNLDAQKKSNTHTHFLSYLSSSWIFVPPYRSLKALIYHHPYISREWPGSDPCPIWHSTIIWFYVVVLKLPNFGRTQASLILFMVYNATSNSSKVWEKQGLMILSILQLAPPQWIVSNLM